MTIRAIIEGIIAVEGGYSDHPSDRGGKTMYGITEAVARKHGFTGPMHELPKSLAFKIYEQTYYRGPNFHLIHELSPAIAEEVTDTGVNMGVGTAAKFLQRALNAFNRQQRDYSDIVVDGAVGQRTITALRAFLGRRGKEGEAVMLTALNSLQGARYVELVERREQNEDFIYGWFKNRVVI